MGGRDPRKLQRGGEPGSKGEGEGGGAEETLLQHGVSSPRGGCKHGTRAPFQGSPLKGQRLRCDLDSAAAFITFGAGAARRAGRRARRCSSGAQGDVASLPAARLRGASAAAWQDLHPAHRSRPPSAKGQGLPHPLGAPTPGSARGPRGSTSAQSEERGQAASQFSHLGNGNNALWSIKLGLLSYRRRSHLAVCRERAVALCSFQTAVQIHTLRLLTRITHRSFGTR